MKKGLRFWKAVAPLLCLSSIGDLAMKAAGGGSGIGAWAESLGFTFAALAVCQYAFGWPKLPRLVWRIFGPIFSVVMIWSVASGIGWLGTRLAIKRLTLGEQVATSAILAFLAVYGLIVVVPLYRLGDWKHLAGSERSDELAGLQDTFA